MSKPSFYLFGYAFCAAASLVQPAFAAVHDEVIPYDAFKTRLTMTPGQTYLSFMKNQVKPALDAFEEDIKKDPATKANQYGKLQTNLIAQGDGVAIRIDERNYFFNVGYLDGSDPKNDVKSGRSYGVGPTGRESDPSDLAYLTELEAYLRDEPQAAGDFVEALMQALINCDTSGWAKLSGNGQIVATDFLAIYTAESDRHIMVKLAPNAHPWEIDLAAATLVSIFDVESGMIMQDGKLVKGSIKQWWAKGTQGSGIGETRRQRLALQKMIAAHESTSKEAAAIAKIVGVPVGSDVIQNVLSYLNSPNCPSTMTDGEGKNLPELMHDYMLQVRGLSLDGEAN